jgi:trans-aconitate 2-methyltransferase
MKWEPAQYLRYSDERGRPFFDLIDRIRTTAPRHIVDMGCGPGNLTAQLAQCWPSASIVGLDSSPEMVTAASELAAPNVTFGLADASTWVAPADTDVIISNATLQWVPSHLDVLARWAAAVPAGGSIAIQVPGNFGSPSHQLMRSIVGSPRWRGQLEGVLRHDDAVAEPDVYAEVLMSAGLAADVWETTYLHVLQGEDPVLEWVRGTGLRPILAALGPDDAAEFEREYAAALREAYPASQQGTLFPFRRIFAVGHREVSE